MALTYQESVEQTITAGEQLHQIVNGTATTEVTVEDGSRVPSIRKALLDNFYFKDPIPWQVGQTERVFNQLRQFTDGSWWYAPSATASNPISMGITPVGDSLWKIYDFDAIGKLNPQIREALRRSYAEAGFTLVPGSFELGGTVTTATDVLLYEADGHAYNWDGVFPVGGKVVPQNSTPATTGGVGPDLWLDQAGATLRDQFLAGEYGLIGSIFGTETFLVPSEFPDLQSAVEYVVKNRKFAADSSAVVMLESGYMPSSGLLLNGVDAGKIIIRSQDPVVELSPSFSGNLFVGVASRFPVLDALFDAKKRCGWGYGLQDGSYGAITTGSGVKNSGGRGLYVNNSRCLADGAIFTGAGSALDALSRAAWFTRRADVSAENLNISDCACATAMYVSRLSTIHSAYMKVNNAAGLAIWVHRGSTLNAQESEVVGCINAIRINRSSTIVMNSSTFSGVTGNFSDGVDNGSNLNLQGCTITAAAGNFGIGPRADRSILILTGATIDGFGTGVFGNSKAEVDISGATISGSILAVFMDRVCTLGASNLTVPTCTKLMEITRGSTAAFDGLSAPAVSGQAALIDTSSVVDLDSANIVGSVGNSAQGLVINRARVSLRAATINGFSTKLVVNSRSDVDATSAKLIGTGAGTGVDCSRGSLNLSGATVTGHLAGRDILCQRGSAITADGCSTTNGVGSPALIDTNMLSFNAVTSNRGVMYT